MSKTIVWQPNKLILLNKEKVTQLANCNFTKSNTPPCVFFTFFKFYK